MVCLNQDPVNVKALTDIVDTVWKAYQWFYMCMPKMNAKAYDTTATSQRGR